MTGNEGMIIAAGFASGLILGGLLVVAIVGALEAREQKVKTPQTAKRKVP